jgi:hypothetical protein
MALYTSGGLVLRCWRGARYTRAATGGRDGDEWWGGWDVSGARLTPQAFVAKWRGVELSERASVQEHFLDLCALFGHPTPAAADPTGDFFTFEKGITKTGGGQGFADVWKRGFFAWEYKKRRKDLAAAYQQLLLYREPLENPRWRGVYQRCTLTSGPRQVATSSQKSCYLRVCVELRAIRDSEG